MHAEARIAFDPIADLRGELAKLSMLARCRQGLPAYYLALLPDRNEVLRVAAMSALLELNVLKPDQWELAVQMSRHDAVKTRAFKFFMARYEYDLAAKAVATPSPGADALRSERMWAEHARDLANVVRCDRELFLASGMIENLYDAERTAEQLGGWRAAVPWAKAA